MKSGYTVDFLKFFWIDIGKIIHRSIIEYYDKNQIDIILKEGLITCLPKPGKNRNKLKKLVTYHSFKR